MRRRQGRHRAVAGARHDEDAPQGVRPINNRGGIKQIGLVPSLNGSPSTWTEGPIEHAFVVQAYGVLEATEVRAQPCLVEFTYDPATGEIWLGHRPSDDPSRPTRELRFLVTYPDFLVSFREGSPWLVEIKHSQLARDPKVIQKRMACELFARKMGWEFHFITEKQVRTPLLDQARRSRRYGRMIVPSNLTQRIRDLIEAVPGGLTCRDLAGRLATSFGYARPVALAVVYALLAQGTIVAESGNGPGDPCTVVAMRRS